MIHVLPDTMVHVRCHAFMEVVRRQPQHHAADAIEVLDPDRTGALEGSGRGLDLPGPDQGMDQGKLAVCSALFHADSNPIGD